VIHSLLFVNIPPFSNYLYYKEVLEDDIKIISEDSEYYPPLLREIHQPPKQLYVRGNLEVLQHPQLLAVVGSRHANYYGKQCIEKLLPPVIEAGVVIVSGLALGIDALSHQACVAAGKPTIAVLGSGIDDPSVYPKSHISLAHQIIDHGGAVISEYGPGTPSFRNHFPARNRIIAGLAHATLVVQAADRSGSLITARLTLEANRELVAVPGGITDPLAVGTNRLIHAGATPILQPQHLLDLFNIRREPKIPVLEQPTTVQP
jgi:DNA processing protein